METTYPGTGRAGHLNSLIQKPQLKGFSGAVNRAWIPLVCGETENLLVSGRPRHFSETFTLSWRCPSPLPYPSHDDDAWVVEHPKNENRHCLCRIGMVWGYSKLFPTWLFGVHAWYNIFCELVNVPQPATSSCGLYPSLWREGGLPCYFANVIPLSLP